MAELVDTEQPLTEDEFHNFEKRRMSSVWKSLSSLVEKEGTSYLDQFIEDFEDFEEIPLVSRYKQLDKLKETLPAEEIQFFLVNSSIFILNTIIQHARVSLSPDDLSHFFACITFPSIDDDIADCGVALPCFLVSRKISLFDFLRLSTPTASTELHPVLGKAFTTANAEQSFTFITKINPDPDGDFTRIYAIPCSSYSMLKSDT